MAIFIKLTKAVIHKYKSLETEQSFDVNEDITVMVGMNESGKTSILEALAKVNYFEKDSMFTFEMTRDYPRKQKKKAERSEETPKAVTLYYDISDDFAKKISEDIGVGLNAQEFSVSKTYSNSRSWSVDWVNTKDFVESKVALLSLENTSLISKLNEIGKTKTYKNFDDYSNALREDETISESELDKATQLEKYFCNPWDNSAINGYIVDTYLSKNLPKFMYYDEYYALPSRFSLGKVSDDGFEQTNSVSKQSDKTVKALIELAGLNLDNLLEDYETLKSELEATSSEYIARDV